jgi:hypothetical protein
MKQIVERLAAIGLKIPQRMVEVKKDMLVLHSASYKNSLYGKRQLSESVLSVSNALDTS